jgi:class 3 adenylate cyclase
LAARFLNRLLEAGADRIVPVGYLRSIESPQALTRLINGGLLPSVILSLGLAGVLLAFGEPTAAALSAFLSACFLTGYLVIARTGSVLVLTWIVTVASVGSHAGIHLSMGGLVNSGVVLGYGVSLAFVTAWASRKGAVLLAAVYGLLVVVALFLEETLSTWREPPEVVLSALAFGVMFLTNIALITLLQGFILGRFSFERARAENLLLNVLPKEIASELKETGTTKARSFDSVSVLFADVVGFTRIAREATPEETVALLSEAFTGFDRLAREHGCEKIHTVGDAYVVAAGVPVPNPDHAASIATLALDMRDLVDRDSPLTFRFGIGSGPVVAGVIGSTKFQYDIWGDTVNLASRMETLSAPGRIQIAESTMELLDGRFSLVDHGEVEVKGMGTLRTCYLERISTSLV